ncbi:hypothetical protein PIROE2DRAFT_4603, partial [Piromyces sp. E2]
SYYDSLFNSDEGLLDFSLPFYENDESIENNDLSSGVYLSKYTPFDESKNITFNYNENSIDDDILNVREFIDYLSRKFPYLSAKYYVDFNFSENTKNEIEKMFDNIKEAIINRIPKMEWLDEDTKTKAIEKALNIKK